MESCRFLLNNFPESGEVKNYLDSRLGNVAQDKFQFGYFPNIFNLKAITDLVGEQDLRDVKLLFTKNIEDSLYPRTINELYFEYHPLVFPFKDAYGKIVGLVARSLLPEEELKKLHLGKYKNTKFKKGNFLFGLYECKQAIIDADLVYVVEGQFDAIKAWERGIKNIVALGTSNMTAYQFSVINRYTNNIILLLDNDEAGQKGRTLITKKFGNLANIQNWYIPKDYNDIDEYLTKENITRYEDMSFIITV
ncbi:MAG TPA: toprim domain-containing protein [Nitrososphaeraceae archaeon]|nr:toprim domain-containing protein [Nitrososphaeraceae archaeon]